MTVIADSVAWLCLTAGGFFLLAGGIGVLRFPDVYTRMHAAGMTDTMGAALILAGLAVHEGLTLVSVKLLIILVFLFFTSPTSSFALAHAAWTSGVHPVRTRSPVRNGGETTKETAP